MMATGPPSPEELKLLEPFRGQVPDEVFGEPFVPPVSDGSGQDRALLRKALATAAGRRAARQGRQAAVAERRGLHDRIPARRAVVSAASRALHQESRPRSGSRPASRLIDAVQYRARVEDFDFDMTIERFSMSATPGDSLRPYLLVAGGGDQGLLQSGRHRQSRDRCADRKDHRRRDPRRTDAPPAARFDRVFRAGRYWVPQWYRTTHPIAYWDMFAHPQKPPRYRRKASGAPDESGGTMPPRPPSSSRRNSS